jgi:XRE family transcriptional regulator, fatty acid utilization regulator
VQQKLFLGARLRRLRRERGLQQAAMAGQLGISASYLNHLERNQRPVTAGILVRLAETFDLDVRGFASDGGESTSADQLSEIFADPMFSDLAITRHESVELASTWPAVADSISRLYKSLKQAQRQEIRGIDDSQPLLTAETWVRDYVQQHRNHFPELEEAAEALAEQLRDPLSPVDPLHKRLHDRFGVQVKVVPAEILVDAHQQFDPRGKLLMLSSLLRQENRTFAIAYQLSLLEFADVISARIDAARPRDEGTRHLLETSLANYCATALMMPYGRFLRAAQEHRYSLDPLCREFGANVEQIAHRFTTLSRAGSRGVPFFMLRVDPAGNISKRYAGERFPFSHFGGTCPRWHLHQAFQTPDQTIRQVIETPDEQQFFTISRTVERPVRTDFLNNGLLAIGLGCDVKYASEIIYADGLDLNAPATPIGPACSLCPRSQCGYRATAPIGRALAVHPNRKTISPYPFVGRAEGKS